MEENKKIPYYHNIQMNEIFFLIYFEINSFISYIYFDFYIFVGLKTVNASKLMLIIGLNAFISLLYECRV